MNYNKLIKTNTNILSEAGVSEPELNSWYLFIYACEKRGIKTDDRAFLISHGEEEAGSDIEEIFSELINKRCEKKPLEYITGYTEFMGLKFNTDERALIPRQDTEILTELALKKCDGRSIIELCTGSGAVAVSLAVLGNPKKVTASDISDEALELAAENARLFDADITFIKSDIWENVPERYDIIVANPPYIRTDVIPTLMSEVKDFEPYRALDGGVDGLAFYRRIIAESKSHINSNGEILLEIGYDQAEDVMALLEAEGLTDIRVHKDLSGLDRVVCGVFRV